MNTPVDKKKIAAGCYQRGTEMMGREQYEYAIEMFLQAAMLVPDNLLYRQLLRGAEYKRYKNNKSGAKMSGLKITGIKGKIKKAKLQKKWAEVDKLAEEGLQLNPWEPSLNAELGVSCLERGFEEVAQFAYTKAVEADPKSENHLRGLAQVLEDRGLYNDAIKCWERLGKLDPNNGEVRAKITALHGKSTMKSGGYDEAENTRDVKTGYDAYKSRPGSSPAGQPAADGPGMSIETDLQRAIKKDPASPENYLKLAAYYKTQKEYEKSLEIFEQGLQASGNDPNIREQKEDVELLLLKHNLELAKEASRNNPEDEQKKQMSGALAKELLNREVEILSAREERYPANMQIKYDLAMRFIQRGAIEQAIPLLQKASTDTRLKAEVLVNLGRCFSAIKQPKLAKRQYELAIPAINKNDDQELYCTAMYALARLEEAAENLEAAENHYTEILGVNFSYRDTQERLEKIQSRESA